MQGRRQCSSIPACMLAVVAALLAFAPSATASTGIAVAESHNHGLMLPGGGFQTDDFAMVESAIARPNPVDITISGVPAGAVVTDVDYEWQSWSASSMRGVDAMLEHDDRCVMLSSDNPGQLIDDRYTTFDSDAAVSAATGFDASRVRPYNTADTEPRDGDFGAGFGGCAPGFEQNGEQSLDTRWRAMSPNGAWNMYVGGDLKPYATLRIHHMRIFVSWVKPDAPNLITTSDTGIGSLYRQDNITRDTTPTFSGDDAAPGTIILLVSGGTADANNGLVVGSAAVEPDGTYTVTRSSPDLLDGPESYSVRTFGPDGTTTTNSAVLTITQDTVGPLTVTYPLPLQFSTPTPTATGGASEPARTQLFVDGAANAIEPSDALTAPFSLRVSSPLAFGAHLFAAESTDVAGNTGLRSVPVPAVGPLMLF